MTTDPTNHPGPEARNPRSESAIPAPGSNPTAPGFLAIVSGSYSGTMLPLSSGVTRIGRDGYFNDHVIDDNAVSDLHLSIRFLDGVFILTDMDSENGTRINGQPVDRQQLSPNDLIQIGRTRLSFIQMPSADEQTGSRP